MDLKTYKNNPKSSTDDMNQKWGWPDVFPPRSPFFISPKYLPLRVGLLMEWEDMVDLKSFVRRTT